MQAFALYNTINNKRLNVDYTKEKKLQTYTHIYKYIYVWTLNKGWYVRSDIKGNQKILRGNREANHIMHTMNLFCCSNRKGLWELINKIAYLAWKYVLIDIIFSISVLCST